MFGAYAYDQTNNMRDASECGTNSLCTYKHEWPTLFSAGMKKQAQMSPETEKLWIELRGSEEGGLLYLASPCKADIVVEYSECECEKFYDTAKIHTDFVIQEGGIKTYPCLIGIPTLCITSDIIDTFNVPIDFPHEFKYTDGESISFAYIPEGEEKGTVKTLKNGDMIDSPVMLEQALRGMERDESKDIDELEEWVGINTNKEKVLDKEENQFTFTHMINHNIEQGTLYKSCVKGDWWAFWKEDKNVPCVKIHAEAGYPNDYEQNFCYEKKWDSASKAEVGIFAAEIVAGVVAAALATPETLGAGALPAYCAASMGVSAAGAWALSGTMAEDKWPKGIDQ
jgi:hypothetical protein